MKFSFDNVTCKIFVSILILSIQIPVPAKEKTPSRDLFDMDIEELMNVEVTSFSKRSEKSSKAPGTVYVWTEEQIKAYGFRNLQDVLEATPGFEITNFYFWLNGGQRGYNNNMAGTLVLVNGRRMMMEFFKEAYIMEQYPLEMVKRIEIIQGPVSVLYGSEALQGVINIITKGEGDYPDTTSLQTRYGSFNSKATTMNFRKNYSQESFVWAAASMHETDNPDIGNFVDDFSRFSRSSTDSTRVLTADDYGFFYSPNKERSAYVTFSSKMDPGRLFGGFDFWEVESAGGIEGVSLFAGMNHQERKVFQPYIGYELKFLDDLAKLNAEYQYHHERAFYHGNLTAVQTLDGDTVYPTAFANSGPSSIHTGKLQLDMDLQDYGHYLIAGYEYFDTDFGHQMWSLDSGRYYLPENSPFDTIADPNKAPLFHQRGYSLYIQDQTTLFERFHLTAGIRHNKQDFYEQVTLPRAGVVWELNENHNLKYFYGEAFKNLSMFALTEGEDTLDAKPSVMKSSEIALASSLDLSDDVKIFNNFAFFRNDSEDYLLQQVSAGDFRNVASKFWTEGFEDQIKFLIGRKLSGTASVSHIQTEPFELNGKKTDAYKVPEWKTTLGLIYNFTDRISLGGHLIYHSKVKGDVNTIDGASTEMFTVDPFAIVNLALTCRDITIGELQHISLQIGVHNLFDEEYHHINGRGTSPIQYLQEGRAFMLGCRMEF